MNDTYQKQLHYTIQPSHLWNSIAEMARTQSSELLNTLQAGFKYIESESFDSTCRNRSKLASNSFRQKT